MANLGENIENLNLLFLPVFTAQKSIITNYSNVIFIFEAV